MPTPFWLTVHTHDSLKNTLRCMKNWCTILYNYMCYIPTDFQLKEEMYYKQSKNLFIPGSKLFP